MKDKTINKKPVHVLFVTEKWFGNNPHEKLADAIMRSYDHSGLGTRSSLHFDEYYYQYKTLADFALIEKCIEEKPDLLFFTWLTGPYNPKIETFSVIKKLGIPIVCWWGDFCWDRSIEMATSLTPFINLHLTVDIPIAYTSDRWKNKYKPIWPIPIEDVYFNDNRERDIKVGFVGGSLDGGNRGDRTSYIDYLKEHGIDVFIGGSRLDETLIQYADNMRRTLLSLNFTIGPPNVGRLIRGRAFETLWCGATLLEPYGSFLEYYFTPNVDYIPYDPDNYSDLLSKIEYYLDHDEEREKIRTSGHEKAISKYNSFSHWNTIINRYLLEEYSESKFDADSILLQKFLNNKKDAFCNDSVFISEISFILEKLEIKRFLEMGTYFGFSTDFLNQKYPKLEIISCDINEAYVEFARSNNNKVDYRVCDSLKLLNDTKNRELDFVFLDAHGHGGGLPLEEELNFIGNSNERFVLCVHDCKLPNRKIFGYDSYNGIDISTELIISILNKTSCKYKIFIPQTLYLNNPLRGRCYILVNIDEEEMNKIESSLFLEI